jgi:hypothetical protein
MVDAHADLACGCLAAFREGERHTVLLVAHGEGLVARHELRAAGKDPVVDLLLEVTVRSEHVVVGVLPRHEGLRRGIVVALDLRGILGCRACGGGEE